MLAISQCLAEELKGSRVNESFQLSRPGAEEDGGGDSTADLDQVENLAQNLRMSHTSENGQPGPASNLLGSLNIALRDKKDSAE